MAAMEAISHSYLRRSCCKASFQRRSGSAATQIGGIDGIVLPSGMGGVVPRLLKR